VTLQVLVSRDEGLEAPDDESFSRWVAVALAADADRLTSDTPELSLRISDEAEIADLNQRYRGKPGATNVLSFPVDLPEGVDTDLLGDIIICAPLVRREAEEQGKPAERHWAHLTVHGVLHLLGHDHIAEADATLMEALEIGALASLGYPDPYQPIANDPQGGVEVT
jgi:probable rRNA maturation factor